MADYRGLFQMPNGRWRVYAGVKYVGTFDDPVEAARAYDRAAREVLGNRARLNFPVEVRGEVAYVPVFGHDRMAMVDAADAHLVDRRMWSLTGQGYPATHDRGKRLLMHRAVIGETGLLIDHINHDRWDNRRSNLRVATHAENSRNMRKTRGASRFKGVSLTRELRWQVHIRVEGRSTYLGVFDDEVAAALAYDAAARLHFGSFAWTNFAEERTA